MALKVNKTVTGDEILTLEETKNWLKVTYTVDNDLITSLITQSRELVENYINQSLVLTTLEVWSSPRSILTLPYGPIISIISVTTTGGTAIDYEYDGFEIIFEPNVWTPTTPEAPLYVNTITTYTAGYTTIPAGLKMVLFEIISYIYENRGDSSGLNNLIYQNKFLQQYRNKIWI